MHKAVIHNPVAVAHPAQGGNGALGNRRSCLLLLAANMLYRASPSLMHLSSFARPAHIKGEIWANIFTEDVIVRISPKNGKVTGWINLSALRSYLSRNESIDVLNGIAYDVNTDRIFVTGKYWPKIFEIQLSK